MLRLNPERLAVLPIRLPLLPAERPFSVLLLPGVPAGRANARSILRAGEYFLFGNNLGHLARSLALVIPLHELGEYVVPVSLVSGAQIGVAVERVEWVVVRSTRSPRRILLVTLPLLVQIGN